MSRYHSGLAVAILVGCAMFAAPAVRADVGGAVVLAPSDKEKERIDLSSFSWIGAGPPSTDITRALNQERTPPEKGNGTLTIAKPVTVATPVLESYCSNNKTLPEVVAEIPLWEERFRDNKLHYQQYKLKDVKVTKCAHVDGAMAKVFHLEFSDIEAVPLSEKPVVQEQ